ncbi:MAG: hypothetical protein IPJ59_21235 [Nannocystis sp.]|nr:hypothetical protein [Nannocystis sp.]MBK7827693.1 hypothetical protein [Nannocystis sp.]
MGADVVDGDDVGVGELGEGLGLAQEAELAGAVRARTQQLERDLAVEVGVEGGVDDPHRAGAEAVEDDVAADHRAALELVAGEGEGIAGVGCPGGGVVQREGHARSGR